MTYSSLHSVQDSDEPPNARYVSLIMIPWRHIISVEAPVRWTQDDRTVSLDSSMYF